MPDLLHFVEVMFTAIFSTENVNFFPIKEKSSFAPIDITSAYLVLMRLKTTIYTRYTSFGVSHVYRKIVYGKREFRLYERKIFVCFD